MNEPKVVAVALGNATLGLGLTGVAVREAGDVREAEQILEQLLRQSDAEIVIADDRLRGQFSDWFKNVLSRHTGSPLIIFVPTFENEEAGTDEYINAILKPAVGFEIRLD